MLVIKKYTFLITVLLFTSFALQVLAKKTEDNQKDEVDHLGLVSVLIKDKHFDRALMLLQEIDLKNTSIDKAKYYLLLGLTQISILNVDEAYTAFKQSIKHGQKDKMVYVFLAQVCFKQELYNEAVDALEKAGKVATDLPATFMLKANSYWKLNQLHKAWSALSGELKNIPIILI